MPVFRGRGRSFEPGLAPLEATAEESAMLRNLAFGPAGLAYGNTDHTYWAALLTQAGHTLVLRCAFIAVCTDNETFDSLPRACAWFAGPTVSPTVTLPRRHDLADAARWWSPAAGLHK